MFYVLLRGDAWRVGAAQTEDVLLRRGMSRLRADLFSWYTYVSGRADIYKLQDLTLGMIGPRRLPEMTTKAAETGTLMELQCSRQTKNVCSCPPLRGMLSCSRPGRCCGITRSCALGHGSSPTGNTRTSSTNFGARSSTRSLRGSRPRRSYICPCTSRTGLAATGTPNTTECSWTSRNCRMPTLARQPTARLSAFAS